LGNRELRGAATDLDEDRDGTNAVGATLNASAEERAEDDASATRRADAALASFIYAFGGGGLFSGIIQIERRMRDRCATR